jgi:hypothetical protein
LIEAQHNSFVVSLNSLVAMIQSQPRSSVVIVKSSDAGEAQ